MRRVLAAALIMAMTLTGCLSSSPELSDLSPAGLSDARALREFLSCGTYSSTFGYPPPATKVDAVAFGSEIVGSAHTIVSSFDAGGVWLLVTENEVLGGIDKDSGEIIFCQ